jgi:site-specific recombinase XerD
MAGVDLRTVQQLMGHKDIKMTMRHAHLAPEHLRAAVEKLNVGTDWAQTPFQQKQTA